MTNYRAIRYVASSPETKVLGASVLAFTTNLRAETIKPIVASYHLESIGADDWIDEQITLNILREIEERFSFEELVAVGIKHAEFIPLPPEIDSLEKLLDIGPMLYYTTIHNAPPNLVTIEAIGPQHYRLIYNIPSPPFSTYGIVFGLINRVKHPDQFPQLTILDFGTPYIFEVKW